MITTGWSYNSSQFTDVVALNSPGSPENLSPALRGARVAETRRIVS